MIESSGIRHLSTVRSWTLAEKKTCRYKDFLVNLTPAEWKEQKREEKKQRKLQRRKIAVPQLSLEVPIFFCC